MCVEGLSGVTLARLYRLEQAVIVDLRGQRVLRRLGYNIHRVAVMGANAVIAQLSHFKHRMES